MDIDEELEERCEITRKQTEEDVKRLNDLHDYFERIGSDSSHGSPVFTYLDNICRSISSNARLDAYNASPTAYIPPLVVDQSPSMTFRQFVCHLQQRLRSPLRCISTTMFETPMIIFYGWTGIEHDNYLRNKNRKMKDVIFEALNMDASEDNTGMITLDVIYLGYIQPARVTFHF